MFIRQIEINDAEKFLNMLIQLDNETSYMMYEPGERRATADEMKANIKKMYDSGSIIFGVEDKGNIVGFLSAERGFANRIRHTAYIVIGIMKNYRGMGIGKSLFVEAEKWANKNNIKRLELTVMINNKAAVNLYTKVGFKIEGVKEKSCLVGKEYIDEYYMAKII